MINLSSELISKFVQCVEEAVGDDIKIDIQRNGLQTHNSVPSRIWDFLNTNLINNLSDEYCTVIKAQRGPWEMLIVYEKTNKCIFTFMREKRFSELQKNQSKRNKMHYLDMLTRYFNSDLVANSQQLSLLPKTFSDEEKLCESVSALLSNFGSNTDIIRNHVLILFEAANCQLTNIRAVMVNPSLEIADEQDWSRFISAFESIVVEQVIDPESPNNQPNRNLTLTAKAISRKDEKSQIKASREAFLNES